MSQKAWMQAYTKGSKSLQARLAKIHANNPEFQEFVKKHGFGGNLSVKQSGLQKKSSVGTVKPVDAPSPEKNANIGREALIKAAAEKIKNRRAAHANRVAFGGELGGGFGLHNIGFRTYRESVELHENKTEAKIKAHPAVSYYGGKQDDHFVELHKGWEMDGQRSFGNKSAAEAFKMLKHVKKIQATDESVSEDIAYKDGTIKMHRGGWVAMRDGKMIGTRKPSEEDAKWAIDSTRKSLGQKTIELLKKKRAEIAKGLGRMSLATESTANRRRVRSWDSAIMPELRPLRVKPKAKLPFDPDPPKANPGVVVGKNDPGYSRARHLARQGLKKAMEQK